MAVTITDVARHAGVSRSTVSYALSGDRSISLATIRRVERSIAELGFRPHAGARSIRTRRTAVIAMALPMVYGSHNQVQMRYVSVIAVCPDGEAERCTSPVTLVSLPAAGLARTAVRIFARRLDGEPKQSRGLLAPTFKPRARTAVVRWRGVGRRKQSRSEQAQSIQSQFRFAAI